MKRLVLIDGHAIVHRAYYAFPSTLKTRRGEIVNAVYGFARMLLSVFEELRPKYAIVAFDLPKPTFRHREFIGYQAQRPKMEEELKKQLERVFEVVRVLNIPIFAIEGYEADDVIGTLAIKARKKVDEVIIVTGDRDLLQLVRPKIKLYAPKKGFSDPIIFNQIKVKEEMGILPTQIVDYKGLVGDSSDNYPGVPGIGPKTAVKLLLEYRNLDNIYKNLEKIEPKIAKKLIEGAESAALSKKLAKIVTNVPLKLDLKTCRVGDYDREKAIALFRELEFKTLIDKLPKTKEAKRDKTQNRQMELL